MFPDPSKTVQNHALPYRRDIDGLRAFAVVSVVLYHFGLPLQGGFVGVDVFFVISGFLIGGILWREYDQTGRLRLKNFYVRRFRRLAPAFFVMSLVITVLGWALLLPFEFREHGKTLIAATVYLSNVLFYRSAGYFDAASEEKPLLHTWSLAVEEQFYIFVPLLILILARNRWLLLGSLVLVWAASLAACVALTPTQAEATFYLFPFRAWEMLSGVLLAIWGHETKRAWRGHALLSWLGFALILASFFLIPAGPGFPGMLALAPVLGTVLLLANGTGQNPVNTLLRNPVAVFFGAISYSLYLWHWPVFTLSTYLRNGYVNLLESLVWMTISVGLAYLSWRYVENPVRRAQRLPSNAVLGGAALASVILLAMGGVLFKGNGLPQRFGEEANVHIAATGDFLQDWSRCHTAEQAPLNGLEICPIGPEGPPQLLIWGDSHVRAFREGLNLAATEANVPALIIWRAGCPPLFGLRKEESAATHAQDQACTEANLQMQAGFAQMEQLKGVLLVGRWAYYATGTGVGLDAKNRIALHPAEGVQPSDQSQVDLLSTAAQRTVNTLDAQGVPVFVLRQPPEIPEYDSRDAAREAAHLGWPLAASSVTQAKAPRDALAPRAALADAPWQKLAAVNKITFIDTWPRFCDAKTCRAVHDGVGQFFDNNHVTNSAALRVRDLFVPLFTGAPDQREALMAAPDQNEAPQ